MRPYRAQRNRRHVDPLGVNPPARGVIYAWNFDHDTDPRVLTGEASCPINVLPPANQIIDSTAGATGVSVVKLTANQIQVTMDADCGVDDIVEFDSNFVRIFGPNVVGAFTSVRLNQV